jgi:F0F1-type ATP synthase membrane subunit b/b'
MSRTTESSFVRIPNDLYQEIVAVAKEDDHSIASTIRACVRAELQRRKAAAGE